MTICYEYECRTCGMTHLYRERGLEGQACQRDGCAGTIKRVWHANVMWPMGERGH